jgi:hypothetical protein
MKDIRDLIERARIYLADPEDGICRANAEAADARLVEALAAIDTLDARAPRVEGLRPETDEERDGRLMEKQALGAGCHDECGPLLVEEDYEPFGSEWKSEMMKFRKSELIELYRGKCTEIIRLKAGTEAEI